MEIAIRTKIECLVAFQCFCCADVSDPTSFCLCDIHLQLCVRIDFGCLWPILASEVDLFWFCSAKLTTLAILLSNSCGAIIALTVNFTSLCTGWGRCWERLLEFGCSRLRMFCDRRQCASYLWFAPLLASVLGSQNSATDHHSFVPCVLAGSVCQIP